MSMVVPALVEVIVAPIALVIAVVMVGVVAIAAWFGYRGRRGQHRQSDKRCDNMLEHKSSLIARCCKHLRRHSRGGSVTPR
jgi:hypothetical protein